MSDSRPSSGCTPAAKQRQFPWSSERREWQLLEPELLCQALSDDSDATLRRAARAVCRDWRAVVDGKLITQLCCDVDQLQFIRPLPGLRHVVVQGEIRHAPKWQQLQQDLWTHSRKTSLSSSIRSSKGPSLRELRAPRGNLSPLAALPGVQAVTLRCLPLLTHNFQQQAAHLTHLTSLTLHEPPHRSRSKSHVKGVRQALSALPHLKAVSLVDVEGTIIERVLQLRWGTTTCPWLAGLQSLTVQHSSRLPPLRDALASLTSCTSLALIDCSLSRGLPASLGHLTNLKALDLSYSNSSVRLPKSCWSRLTALTRLSLSGAGLQGYRHVPLKDMPSLVHLEMRDHTFRGKALLGCTALQVLDVRGSQLDDATLTALDTALTEQPTLKRVLYGRRGQPDKLFGLPIQGGHPGVTFVCDWEWERRQMGGEGGSSSLFAWDYSSDSDTSSSSDDSDGGFRLCNSISPPPNRTNAVSDSSHGSGSQSGGLSDSGSEGYSTGSDEFGG